MQFGVSLSAAAVMLLAPLASGWQLIHVNACIWNNNDQSKEYQVDWAFKTLHAGCASAAFYPPQGISVEFPGLTCTEVGYLYLGDSCEGGYGDATYYLSYHSPDSTNSGATTLFWEHENRGGRWRGTMRLQDASPSTSICMTKSHCSNGWQQSWSSGNESIWIVFEPGRGYYSWGGPVLYDAASADAGAVDGPVIDLAPAPVAEFHAEGDEDDEIGEEPEDIEE